MEVNGAGGPTSERAKAPKIRRPKFLFADQPKVNFTRRLGELKTLRSSFIGEWADIRDYINPKRARFEYTDRENPRRASKIINSRATYASRTLAAGMQSGVSSPARPWFRLSTPDPDMANAAGVQDWLNHVSKLMLLIFAKSNFYGSIHTLYGDLGDFGSGVMIIDEDFEDVIRCTIVPVGEYYLGVGARNSVDTMYREYAMRVGQIVEKWGDSCSTAVMNCYDRGSYDTLVPLIHAIEPNRVQIPGMKGSPGMPIASVYFETGGDKDKTLEAKGYRDNPLAAPRWSVMAGDIYGTGPGSDAIGDAKALQVLERDKARAINKLATPPMQGPPSAKASPVSHVPGGMSYVDPGAGNGRISPLYEIQAAGITAIGAEIKEHELRLSRAYYEDLFLMLAQSDRREITAREIDERHEEKLLALGPVLERLHDELLNVAIDRTFNIAWRAGIIPPPPKELEGVELKVEYISILAQAQRMVAVGGIERVAGFVGNLAAANPKALDKLDMDRMIDLYAEAVGTDPSIINTNDELDKRREAAAQQEQQAVAMQQGLAAAQGAETLSKADMGGGGNLLQTLVNGGGMGGGA
jgi:hypothetical protein